MMDFAVLAALLIGWGVFATSVSYFFAICYGREPVDDGGVHVPREIT